MTNKDKVTERGGLYANVLGMFDPYIKFIYVLFRWEDFASKLLWGLIICGPGPFLHWGPRPEPRKVMAEDR